MTSFLPITASVDASFIQKADRVFNASIRSMFDELLQNSRRAGSTCVEIDIRATYNGTLVCLADNGCGIENPSKLLTLAKSNWTGCDEDPAGMGLFALARCEGVVVRSHNWVVELTPACFVGTESFTPKLTELYKGTRISWFIEHDTPVVLGHAEAAAKFCDIAKVIVNHDTKSTTFRPTDFLEETVFQLHVADLCCTIGLEECHSRQYVNGDREVDVNFHGVQFVESLPFDKALSATRFNLKLNIHTIGALQFVLPARNELVHNDGRKRLVEACHEAVYRWLAKHHYGNHELPYDRYKDALQRGIDIGQARPYSIMHDEFKQWKKGKLALCRISTELDLSVACSMLHDAKDEYGAHSYMYHKNLDSYEGYDWYDALPVLDAVSVTTDGGEHPLEDEAGRGDGLITTAVLRVWMMFSDGTRVTYDPRILITTDNANCQYEYAEDENRILISSKALEDEDALCWMASHIREHLFSDSDDWDSENSERYSELFEADAQAALLKLHGGGAAAARFRLDEWLKTIPWDLRFVAWTVSHDGVRTNNPVVESCTVNEETA